MKYCTVGAMSGLDFGQELTLDLYVPGRRKALILAYFTDNRGEFLGWNLKFIILYCIINVKFEYRNYNNYYL